MAGIDFDLEEPAAEGGGLVATVAVPSKLGSVLGAMLLVSFSSDQLWKF